MIGEKDTAARKPEPPQPGGQLSGWNRFWMWVLDFVRPWGIFIKLVGDPVTLLLLASALALTILSSEIKDEGQRALWQVLLAVLTGIAGARMASALSENVQEAKLYSSGRMAVRGLRTILVKTLALERRLDFFQANVQRQETSEVKAAVAQRDLAEILESIRTLQVEISGAIDNWGDVVPDAGVSLILADLAELREQLSKKDFEVNRASEELRGAREKGELDAQENAAAQERYEEVVRERDNLQESIATLRKAAAAQPVAPSAEERLSKLRKNMITNASWLRASGGNNVTILDAETNRTTGPASAEERFGPPGKGAGEP